MKCADYIEAKPGHSAHTRPRGGASSSEIKQGHIKVLFAASYFDRNKVQTVADRSGATLVQVPMEPGVRAGVNDYFTPGGHLGDRSSPRPSRRTERRRSDLTAHTKTGRSMLDLMIPPIVAALVILLIHAYLGLHVIARQVIFVDLAFAQIAAFGTTVALLLRASRWGRPCPRSSPWAPPCSAPSSSASPVWRKARRCRRRPSSASCTWWPRRR